MHGDQSGRVFVKQLTKYSWSIYFLNITTLSKILLTPKISQCTVPCYQFITTTYLTNRNTVSASMGDSSKAAMVHKQPETQLVSGV